MTSNYIYLYSSESHLSEPLRKLLRLSPQRCFSVDSKEVREYLTKTLGKDLVIPCVVLKENGKIKVIKDEKLMQFLVGHSKT